MHLRTNVPIPYKNRLSGKNIKNIGNINTAGIFFNIDVFLILQQPAYKTELTICKRPYAKQEVT